MSNPKKICLIAPSLQMGGIERAMSTLANYFVSKGHEVYFVTIFPFEHFFELDNRVHLYEPSYSFTHGHHSTIYKLTYNWKIFGFQGHIYKTVNSIKPDVIMSFGDWLPHQAMLVLHNKYPFYYCNRSNPNIVYGLEARIIRSLAYKLTPPTGIIAQTSAARDRKLKIVGNTIPIEIIPNPAREVQRYNIKKENWIISVGRLHLEKGFLRLLEAFKGIDAKDWKLVLVGGGVHEKEIKAKAQEMGIFDKVIFTGKSKNVDELLAKSKIYVMASHQEGFPNALCEAMAAGLACISFDIVAGPRDIIKDGVNGFLIPDNDIQGLSKKMQHLIDNPTQIDVLGKEAEKVTTTFSIKEIGERYLNFIFNR